jgi:putative copper export protein
VTADIAGLAPILARGLHTAATLSAFGTLVFQGLIARPALAQADAVSAGQFEQRLSRILGFSIAAAWAAAAIWLPLQAAEMAGAESASEVLRAIPIVLFDTRFGDVLLLRLALLAAGGAVARLGKHPVPSFLATLAAGLACVLQALLCHGAAEGGCLLASEALHGLASGAWLGSLLPLYLLLRRSPGRVSALAARRFFPLGLGCVLTLGVTALVQGEEMTGDLAGLVGTSYGRVELSKIGLFLLLLAVAAIHRLVLAPALAGPGAERAHRRLCLSIAVETVLGLAVVVAAAGLATLPPGAHEKAIWPFALQPSLDALADPYFRRQVIEAAAAVGGAALLTAISLVWRRGRWPARIAAIILCALAPLPHLNRLLVTADQAHPIIAGHRHQ